MALPGRAVFSLTHCPLYDRPSHILVHLRCSNLQAIRWRESCHHKRDPRTTPNYHLVLSPPFPKSWGSPACGSDASPFGQQSPYEHGRIPWLSTEWRDKRCACLRRSAVRTARDKTARTPHPVVRNHFGRGDGRRDRRSFGGVSFAGGREIIFGAGCRSGRPSRRMPSPSGIVELAAPAP